ADHVTLVIEEPALADARIESAHFFPFANDVIDHAAKQELARGPGGLTLKMAPNELSEGPPASLAGVLVLEEDLGGSVARQGFVVQAGTAAPAAAAAGSVGETGGAAAPPL